MNSIVSELRNYGKGLSLLHPIEPQMTFLLAKVTKGYLCVLCVLSLFSCESDLTCGLLYFSPMYECSSFASTVFFFITIEQVNYIRIHSPKSDVWRYLINICKTNVKEHFKQKNNNIIYTIHYHKKLFNHRYQMYHTMKYSFTASFPM